MGKLSGKIALITGGNSGIGLATAKQFVAEGAYVFISGRRQSELAKAAQEIGENVTRIIQGDVSNLADLDRLFSQINQEKGRLDIIFANAGVARYGRLGEITEELYDLIFDINVKGLLFTVQKAPPLLADGASIILNASIATTKGFPGMSVYSATKAAVRSFARTWTNELRDRRIRVNAISPGHIDTPVSCTPLFSSMYHSVCTPAPCSAITRPPPNVAATTGCVPGSTPSPLPASTDRFPHQSSDSTWLVLRSEM